MLIEAVGISKNYGKTEAIKNIDFTLDAGQILGFLGPNGAGKTTVMRMLSGFHFPDSGVISIEGYSVEENPVETKKYIGYLPENISFYSDMTPEAYLGFIANARLVPKAEKRARIENAINAYGLGGREHQIIETLSRGYKQRLGLAQALVHNPSVLILDEPLTGLDPAQIIEFRSLIRELGKTKGIIFSTHILQEVSSVCTHYLILNEGSIAAQGPVDSDTDLEAVFASLSGSCNFA